MNTKKSIIYVHEMFHHGDVVCFSCINKLYICIYIYICVYIHFGCENKLINSNFIFDKKNRVKIP